MRVPTVSDETIMWIPGGMVFLIPVIGLLIALLVIEERPVASAQVPTHRSRVLAVTLRPR